MFWVTKSFRNPLSAQLIKPNQRVMEQMMVITISSPAGGSGSWQYSINGGTT
jgi:hypothetical protein